MATHSHKGYSFEVKPTEEQGWQWIVGEHSPNIDYIFKEIAIIEAKEYIDKLHAENLN
ncbi:MAG: hypothetical protein HC836_34630 [Richelia sp. RM2_1_2]|nr:hypothetical protein [Richelia sp. RM2_1_2]